MSSYVYVFVQLNLCDLWLKTLKLDLNTRKHNFRVETADIDPNFRRSLKFRRWFDVESTSKFLRRFDVENSRWDVNRTGVIKSAYAMTGYKVHSQFYWVKMTRMTRELGSCDWANSQWMNEAITWISVAYTLLCKVNYSNHQ